MIYRNTRTIAYRMAYVRVTEWVKDPINIPMPSRQQLENARIHAETIPDYYILDQINQCEMRLNEKDKIPTPSIRGSTKKAFQIANEKIDTQRYSSMMDNTPTAKNPISKDPLSAEELNHDLENFIKELEYHEKFGKLPGR